MVINEAKEAPKQKRFSMEDIEIKRRMMDVVKSRLREKIATLNKAMGDAQFDANQHIGAMESRYDTFKEEAQALRDGFAVQVQKTSEVLAAMEQIALRKHSTVEPGAIIVTDSAVFFISTGLIDDPLEIDGVKYDCVSMSAPIIQRLRNARTGDVVDFGGSKVKVVNIF